MMNRRGQGTIEYLVILGIVLLIALLAFPYILKTFSNPANTIDEVQSKRYWQNIASPFVISDYEINPNGATVVLQNNDQEDLNLGSFTMNGVTFDETDVLVSSGQRTTLTTSTLNCTAGQKYSYKIHIQYSTADISDRNQSNDAYPLVGPCGS